jgi:hypothetical protein
VSSLEHGLPPRAPRRARPGHRGRHSAGHEAAPAPAPLVWPLQVRCQAQAAHEEAAQRIEADVNAGNPQGQWHLDVHGLHVSEAIDAVERRLALLEWAAPAAPPGTRCMCCAACAAAWEGRRVVRRSARATAGLGRRQTRGWRPAAQGAAAAAPARAGTRLSTRRSR